MAFVAAGMLGIGLDGLYENHRFAMHSEHTQGSVDATYDVGNMGRYSMHYQHTLSYSYSIGGVTYSSGAKIVAASTARRYHAHDAIPVLYLRDAPGDSRPDLPAEDTIYQRAPILLIVMGALCLGVGGASLLQRRKTARRY